MRHITDGELHAYLDGALDLLPEGRGEEIREHLSGCPACRERLQDEEEVRERSMAIMAGLDLGTLDLPTFEELRERAAAPRADGGGKGTVAPDPGEVDSERMIREARQSRYRGPLKGVPLAWAATIVLALGVGWMGGEIWRTFPQEGRPAGLGEETDGGGGVEDRGSVGARVDGDAPEAEGAGRAGRVQPMPRGPEAEPHQGVVADARTGDSGRVDPGAPRAGTDILPPAPDRDDKTPAVTGRTPGEQGMLEALAGVLSSEASLAPQRLYATADGAPVPDAAAWALTGAGSEEPVAESSLAVPGLRVLSVDWEEWLPGERALHIRQLLSVGDTLELRYLGMLMGMEPFGEDRAARKVQAMEAGVDRPLSPAVLEASLPPGWNQVEMRWGRGWLVARAPLPEASIKALLRTLR